MEMGAISKTLTNKKAAKDYLRNKFGLNVNKRKLVLSIIVDEKSKPDDALCFLKSFLEGIKAVSVSVLILTPQSLKGKLDDFKSPRGVFVMQSNNTLTEKALEASDVSFVFPLAATTQEHLNLMWHLGVVPIAPEKSAQDYDPNKETGNSFITRKDDAWGIFAALVRAAETFRFPYDWKHIVRQALKAIPLEG